MSHVARADWAAQVPASGIQGVIPATNLPATPTGSIDISQVKAAGYAPGQIPVWNGSRFVPGNLPVVPPGGSGTTFVTPVITWGATLRPLESTEQSLSLPGVLANSQVFVPAPTGQDYLFFRAKVTAAPTVLITATNMSGSNVTLIDGGYKIFVVN